MPAAFFLALFSASVFAGSMTLDWDADPGATGYRVYSSIDGGVIWTLAETSPTLPITVTALPDTGLVLLRACAFNAVVEACRTSTGFFFNGDWSTLTVNNLSTP